MNATKATINSLEAEYGDFKALATDKFTANDAAIKNLETDKLSANDADIKYANIDFANIGVAAIEKLFADSGIIKDLVVSGGHITGELVGVTIKGDLIEGNTIVADKLVVKGEDGLYYKLNTNGVTIEAQQTEYNSLNGSIITAKSITATKVNVDDLVAFDATIGGFNITSTSIYSGAKESVENSTRGIYLDNTGQIAFGDTSNFLKYYKNQNGNYILEISADSLLLGSGKKNVETSINGAISRISSAETAITQNAEQIQLKASKSDVDNLSTRVSSAETSITTNAEQIALKANKSDLDTAVGRISSAETAITQNANNISLAATRIEANESNIASLKLTSDSLTSRVSVTETDIDEVQETAINAQNSADGNSERIGQAESIIQQLSDSISMLVVDESGESLMTQEGNRWTFSMAQYDETLNSVSSGLDALVQDVGDTQNTVELLNQAVNDLGVLSDYIVITTYNDQPCIELGESDNDFKLRITNTEIQFAEGTTIPAYLSNQKLYIEKAEVMSELQHGGFAWKARDNGNLGLIWRGVTS